MAEKVSNAVMEWVKSWVAGWVTPRYFARNMHQFTRRGEIAGVPIVTNREGYVDSSFIEGEFIQDTVGAMATDSASVDFTYDDETGALTAAVKPAGVDHGSLAGLGDDDHPQYVEHNGSSNATARYEAAVADIGTLQALTIDITTTAHTRRFISHIDLVLGRNGNISVYGLMHMVVLWQTNSGGTNGTVHSHEYTFAMSGTATGASATAITNGIRITFSSSAFGNTLTDNRLKIETTGQGSNDLAYTVNIT